MNSLEILNHREKYNVIVSVYLHALNFNDVYDVRTAKIDCEVIAGHVPPPPASTLCKI